LREEPKKALRSPRLISCGCCVIGNDKGATSVGRQCGCPHPLALLGAIARLFPG
jgi:hypothetical protein